MKLSFKVGDKVVYPNHGVTVVEQIGATLMDGSESTFYHLRLLANNSRLMVPVSNIDRVGLRRLYPQKEMKTLFGLLERRIGSSTRDWKDRYRENLEKMKSGRLEDVADVLRNLNQISKRKSLSFREKKMYERAKYLLVSEIAIVKGITEIDAEAQIEASLTKSLGTDH
ncbi:MAG: CarD family transcriptional regulator [Thermoanaerobaculia bacterium]